MVNKGLSNLGIRLDNLGSKPLKTQRAKVWLVVDAVLPNRSPCGGFPANREKNSENTRETIGEGPEGSEITWGPIPNPWARNREC
jgi:hypothetical protein